MDSSSVGKGVSVAVGPRVGVGVCVGEGSGLGVAAALGEANAVLVTGTSNGPAVAGAPQADNTGISEQ